MRHKELRQFIQASNAEGLSPVEKDVFLYYVSVTGNEERRWRCPDEEVADKIGRSRNGVCEARRKLKLRGWIEEKYSFSITVLRVFTDELAPEETEKEPESEVGNSTVESETRLSSRKLDCGVGNPTDYKDKRNREVKEGRKKKEKEPDSPELVVFRNHLKAFQKGYAPVVGKGPAIAETTAIRGLFALARGDTALCIQAHQSLQAEGWRKGRVDWPTVHKNFNYFLANRQNGNGTSNQKGNGTGKHWQGASNAELESSDDVLARIGARPKV